LHYKNSENGAVLGMRAWQEAGLEHRM